MLWRVFPLFGLAASQVTGTVGFWLTKLEFSESKLYGHYVVLRTGGFDGNITVGWQIMPGTNATSDVDFSINPAPMLFSGDTTVQSQMILFMNNQIWEPDKVIKLKLVVDPPTALDASSSMLDVWILDDGDAGVLSVPLVNYVAEEALEFNVTGEPTNESCAVWVTRDGTSSGVAGITVARQDCSTGFPQVRDPATTDRDYFYSSQKEPLIWQDQETGAKCAVGLLTQEAVRRFLFDPFYFFAADRYWIWINADGKLERDEGICFKMSLTNGSSTIISDSFAMLLSDSGLDGGGRIRCVRGLECTMDLSNSSALGGQHGFIQPSEEVDCGPCDQVWNNGNYTELGYASFSAITDDFMANFSMELLEFLPGTYSVCLCGTGVIGQVASMKLTGPFLRNTGFCGLSWPQCSLQTFEALDPVIGRDHVRVMPDCKKPELTPDALVRGAHSVLSTGGWIMENTTEMRKGENGLYEICWCHETASQKCDSLDQFQAGAGSFIFMGPNRVPPLNSMLGEPFQVTNVYGTHLQNYDKMMLLPECGVRHGNSVLDTLNATFDISNALFDFGTLRQEDGFLAKEYQLCWCQPATGRFHSPIYPCDAPEDFLAHIGTVRLICPFRSVDLKGHGHCELCPLMIQQAGGPTGEDCVIAANLLVISVAWLIFMTLFFLAIFAGFRCSRTGIAKFHGMPRKVEDIGRERGQLLITTTGLHNLIRWKGHPIPVYLRGTGHFLLDSKPEKPIPLYVMPVGDMTLEIVDQNGESVSFSADSSMGVVELPFLRTLVHSTLPKCTLPLLLQLIILLVASIVLSLQLLPSPPELIGMILGAVLLALFCLLCWKQLIRNTTSMDRRLKTYASHRAKDDKRKTKASERGKDRGIRVWKILDLYEHFQSHIRDRNMYYLDPNIVRPLTAGVKLSFSEYIGPDEVEWFVSHWWGTSVATYCSALKRHAYEVKVKELGGPADQTETFATALAKGDQSWANTTYWICTFSNNQYRIAEELGAGGGHTQSSFYKALHSEGLKGTCMILDEMTMPLMRSWCLFELLQTIELEEESQTNMRPFGGLLFCTSVGVLNYGSSTVEMSMKIGERLLNLSLRDAQATTEQDKKMIADLVQSSRGSFDEIDTTLRVHIRDALKACHNQVNSDFTSLFTRLP